ncbi:hypothetical protein RvY_04359 [Ramazzottius varieornatus]|uniref:Uncharacterized protein n=1 Tax=Ramazzottius varieornatus TaxID=947166 RepID=A0A1D1UUX7_RAMVA|nr:hypothetical protein RvY_04359 [Ramazzottius varieornatus]
MSSEHLCESGNRRICETTLRSLRKIASKIKTTCNAMSWTAVDGGIYSAKYPITELSLTTCQAPAEQGNFIISAQSLPLLNRRTGVRTTFGTAFFI